MWQSKHGELPESLGPTLRAWFAGNVLGIAYLIMVANWRLAANTCLTLPNTLAMSVMLKKDRSRRCQRCLNEKICFLFELEGVFLIEYLCFVQNTFRMAVYK